MFAEFIYRPTSGEYQEKHFGDNTPDCAWVKFTANTGLEWVGSFQRGWLDNSFIIILDKHEKAFVVANGFAYLIDILTRQMVNNADVSAVKTVVVDDEQFNIYYSDGYDLKCIDMHGNEIRLFDYNEFDDKVTNYYNELKY